jgi:hypothetical protein
MSLDETVDTDEHPSGFAAHFAVLGAGGTIAENLTNLEAVDFPDPVVSILPVRFPGCGRRAGAGGRPGAGSVTGTVADLKHVLQSGRQPSTSLLRPTWRAVGRSARRVRRGRGVQWCTAMNSGS